MLINKFEALAVWVACKNNVLVLIVTAFTFTYDCMKQVQVFKNNMSWPVFSQLL